MLNHRGILTIYNLFMWVCFGMITAIGYIAYRKAKWNIEVGTFAFIMGKKDQDIHGVALSNNRVNCRTNGITTSPPMEEQESRPM